MFRLSEMLLQLSKRERKREREKIKKKIKRENEKPKERKSNKKVVGAMMDYPGILKGFYRSE